MPKSDMIIIDTNLWISFLLSKDYSKLDKLFSKEDLVLLFSQELLEEFVEVARKPKFKKYFAVADLNPNNSWYFVMKSQNIYSNNVSSNATQLCQ